MGATQSVATIRVFCIRNNDHNVHYWNYPNMPAGWQWQSAGISDYELMNPTEDELATIEECFTGSPETIDEMRVFLHSIYGQLEAREIIDRYVLTEKVVLGRTFWERLLSILKRDS
jgi:hypothetical protein